MEKGLVASVRTLIVLVLVAPLIVMTDPLPATFFPYIVGKALFTRTLVEIATGLWLVLAFWYPSHRVPRTWLIAIFGAYVLIVLLSSLLGVSAQRSLWSTYERMQGWIDLAHWFAFTLVLASVFRSFRDWRALLNFNLAMSFIMGLLGIAQINGVQVLGYLTPSRRIDITLGNATFVGAYMLVNILIALAFLSHSLAREAREQPTVSRRVEQRRRRRQARASSGIGISPVVLWRIFWIAVIILDFTVLFRSGTRGALIGLAAGLTSFGAGYTVWGRMKVVRMASFAIVAGLVGLVVLIGAARDTSAFKRVAESSGMLQRLASIGLDDGSTRGRINSAVIGFNGFADRPLLGWGPENYTIAYDKHVTPEIASASTESFDQAHNKIIEELTTKGFLGFASYMAIWLYMAFVIARRVKTQNRDAQLFTLFIGAALSGYFVQNLFLFDTPGTVGQIYMLVGLVAYIDSASRETAFDASTEQTEVSESVPAFAAGMAFLRTDVAKAGALAAAGVVILAAIYFLIVGPYVGARTVLVGLGAYPTRAGSWTERIDYFDRSISASPELANYPRRFMLTVLSNNWDSLTEAEIQATLEIAEREGQAALESEPREWRIHLALANLYQTASARDSSYAQRARVLVEEAIVWAPERIELQQLLVRQFLVEGDADGAMHAIDSFLEGHAEYMEPDSRASQVFDTLKTVVQRAAGIADGG
jgi:O-antigen ligase